MNKKMILLVVIIIAAVGLAGIGIGSYMSASNMKKEMAKQKEDAELEKTIEEKIEEKTSEENKKAAEKADAEKKEKAKKESLISAEEAYNGYTKKAPDNSESLECEITAKEKKIPSNVDQKAQGGMLSCAGEKYRTYVGNDDNYYSYQVGDHVLFRVQWINSTKFFLFSEDISYTAN